MEEFPRFVFMDGGPIQRHGGTFSQALVENQEEMDAALKAGWFATLPEAIEGAKAEADANADPTREELEAKAKELGIEFSPRIGDVKLAERIQSALDAQAKQSPAPAEASADPAPQGA